MLPLIFHKIQDTQLILNMSGSKKTLRRSSSLESTASTNIGPNRTAQAPTATPSREVKSPIYSCAAVLIYCEKHQMIGLQQVPGKTGKINELSYDANV